jgi:hypothetical protein
LECCQNRKLFLAIAVCLTDCLLLRLFFFSLVIRTNEIFLALETLHKTEFEVIPERANNSSLPRLFLILFLKIAPARPRRGKKTKQNCLLLVYLT